MKVFISWSGGKSGSLADILRQWIPGVIQAVRPYYSPDDIAKGARWTNEISKELDESRIGLICLTSDNLEAPWLMFEAGALSKSLDESRVVPLLFGMESTDLKGPLSQFQASKFDKKEMKRVMKMINAELEERGLGSDVLDSVFEMWWPRLEEKIQTELNTKNPEKSVNVRPDRELLEEILQLSRLRANNPRTHEISPRAVSDLIGSYAAMAKEASEHSIPLEYLENLREMGAPLSYIARRLQPTRSQRDLVVQVNRVRSEVQDLLAAREIVDINEEDFDDIPF